MADVTAPGPIQDYGPLLNSQQTIQTGNANTAALTGLTQAQTGLVGQQTTAAGLQNQLTAMQMQLFNRTERFAGGSADG